MAHISKKFRSCFICGVDIEGNQVVLEDSGRNAYVFDLSTATDELKAQYKDWFKNIYLKCIPQVLTVLEYHISTNADGESICVIDKMFINKDNTDKEGC